MLNIKKEQKREKERGNKWLISVMKKTMTINYTAIKGVINKNYAQLLSKQLNT